LLHCFCLQYEREAALRDFSSGTVRVLIATDVASRGLDVKDVGHVINMDLPRAFEDYVHRIGTHLGTSYSASHAAPVSVAS
jgi:ATP-dependent RNA helicase DDX5/DBP2